MISKKDLEAFITQALKTFYHDDNLLIINKASERSFVFRFGIHLHQTLTKDIHNQYKIDTEYNRRKQNPKSLRSSNSTRRIIPDLIIHKRYNPTSSNQENNTTHLPENLLAIEFKTWRNKNNIISFKDGNQLKSIDYDYQKLDSLVRDEWYKYAYGLSIIFEDEYEKCKDSLKWFSTQENQSD